MSRIQKRTVGATLVGFALTLVLCTAVLGVVPHEISYQGFIRETNGYPPTDSLNFIFWIYEEPSGGAVRWGPEAHVGVPVTNGFFEVQLGSDTDLDASVFDGSTLWLETWVQGAPLLPRKPITSVPYSFRTETGTVESVVAGGGLQGMNENGPVVNLDVGAGPGILVNADNVEAVLGNDIDGSEIVSGQVVRSLNALTDDVRVVGGANVVVTADGDSVTISSAGAAGGDVTDVLAGTGIQVANPGGPQPSVSLDTGFADGQYVNEGQSNSVSGAMIQNDAVGASEIAANAVGNSELQDNAVTAAEIAANAVGSSEIASNAVGAPEIAADAVGSSEIAANAVGDSELQNNITVTSIDASDYMLEGSTIIEEVGGLVRIRALNGGGRFDLTSTSARATSDFAPSGQRVFDLGADQLRWKTVYGETADFENPITLAFTDQAGEERAMACPTGPEAVVEDFGTAKLQSGQAHVELDPLFLDAVTIEEEHPMNVQVQLNGDCAGVYVVKGTSGFDVIELGGGRSSVAFDYRVVATRRGSTGRWTRPTVASGSLEEKASR